MQTFALSLTEYDIKTRELFNAALDGADGWSPTRTIIAQIFVAEPTSALSLNGVVQRACARFSIVDESGTYHAFRKELSRFVREGVLRSRPAGRSSMTPRLTLWEVNF